MRIFDETKTREISSPDLERGYLRDDVLLIKHHEEIPEKVIKTVEQVKDELIAQGKKVNYRSFEGKNKLFSDGWFVTTKDYYKDGKWFGNNEEPIRPVIQEKVEAWDETEDIQVYIPYSEEQLEALRVANMKANLPQRIASIAFVKMAERGEIDDVTATECVYAFTPWQPNVKYEAENLREYEGTLYRCISGHTSQTDWTPDVSVSLWKKVGDPREEFPQWSQPIGAFDAYPKGAKVTHNDAKWVSDYENNVWEPGVFGWRQYVEEEAE